MQAENLNDAICNTGEDSNVRSTILVWVFVFRNKGQFEVYRDLLAVPLGLQKT